MLRVPAVPAWIILDETDSTNDEARRRVATLDGPVWIMARRQTAARGRGGRSWQAPRGNLSASLVMRQDGPPGEAATFSFDAALAVADLVAAHVPRARIGLKWPNDVLLGGRKVAGILLEGVATPHGQCLILGIGVNLAHHPDADAARWPATSFRAEAGHAPNPETALADLAAAFARWQHLRARESFAPIRAAWLARAAGLGGPIEVRLPRETLTGTFEDVDPDGRLVLRTTGGARRIAAGDVFFTAAE